jgi:hypothetical protein
MRMECPICGNQESFREDSGIIYCTECSMDVDHPWMRWDLIANGTQHPASSEQRDDGVVDLDEEIHKDLQQLLTFEDIPTSGEMLDRAIQIARLLEQGTSRGISSVMIGGAPFFMSTLERVLKARKWRVCYAFSRRESVENVGDDGKVVKSSTFRHLGFVWR